MIEQESSLAEEITWPPSGLEVSFLTTSFQEMRAIAASAIPF